MRRAVRIKSDEDLVTNTEITYVREDGEEVDIRSYFQGVDVHLHVGELATCDLRLIVPVVDAVALVGSVALDVVPPESIPMVVRDLNRRFREHQQSKYPPLSSPVESDSRDV